MTAMDRNLKKILDTIGRGASLPCYLIYGDEEYLVADALSRIIGALLPPEQRSLNLFQVEGVHYSNGYRSIWGV